MRKSTWILASLVALGATTGQASADAPSPHIVVFESSVSDVDAATRGRERAHGFESRYRYRHALRGFSARLSAQQVSRLEGDPAVDFVSPDRPCVRRRWSRWPLANPRRRLECAVSVPPLRPPRARRATSPWRCSIRAPTSITRTCHPSSAQRTASRPEPQPRTTTGTARTSPARSAPPTTARVSWGSRHVRGCTRSRCSTPRPGERGRRSSANRLGHLHTDRLRPVERHRRREYEHRRRGHRLGHLLVHDGRLATRDLPLDRTRRHVRRCGRKRRQALRRSGGRDCAGGVPGGSCGHRHQRQRRTRRRGRPRAKLQRRERRRCRGHLLELRDQRRWTRAHDRRPGHVYPLDHQERRLLDGERHQHGRTAHRGSRSRSASASAAARARARV